MIDAKLRRVWIGAALGSVLGALGCAAYGSLAGQAGYALGLLGTGFSVAALWGVVKLVGRSATPDAPPSRGTAVVVLAFLVKLPLFVGAGVLAHRLGGRAPTCFLVGLGLVYFALVAWALAQG